MQAFPIAETEVVKKAKRCSFTAEFMRRIPEETDRATKPGEIGAILRREGLCSSMLAVWRKQRESGELAALTPRRRGPQAKVASPLERENDELEGKLARAQKRAERADVAQPVSETPRWLCLYNCGNSEVAVS
jgi:hypothetical protein